MKLKMTSDTMSKYLIAQLYYVKQQQKQVFFVSKRLREEIGKYSVMIQG